MHKLGSERAGGAGGLVGQFVQLLVGYNPSHCLAGLTDQKWSDPLTRTETISNKIAVSLAWRTLERAGRQHSGAGAWGRSLQCRHQGVAGCDRRPHTVVVALAGIANAVSHHDLGII